MRITRIEATPLAIPLAQEFHWSGGAQVGANLVLYTLHTDEGVVGHGEAICEDPVAVASYATLMSRHFVGHEPGEVEAILRSVWTQGRWRFWPQFTQLTLSGMEVACWDALGKALGVPSRTFFGGKVRDEVDFFGFLQGDDPDRLGAHAAELAAQGYEVVYLKVGRAARDDDACVAAVREAIGPAPKLRIDPNEAWSAAEAVERIRRLEVHELDWVEQPVPAGDVAGLARVRRSVHAKIAADQSVFTVAQLRAVLEAEAADVVVQGSHDAGGLLPLRRQAFLCEAHGIDVNRHAFFESEISFLANVQVASTIPNLTLGNQAMHQLLGERLVQEPVELEGGRFAVPDRPGHGFTLDEDAVARAHDRWRRDGPYNTIEQREEQAWL